ncbi:hypothetical protein ACFXTN_003338 [Malus domestica]
MSANEYYRKFTDLSRYFLEIDTNLVEMFRRFRLCTRKKWRSMATMPPCATYQEFYEILLRVEDSENMPSDSREEEEKDNSQKKNDNKDKGQSSQGPRKTQSFKKSGTSSSFSSGGLSAIVPRRGGKFSRGSRFQRPRNSSSYDGPFLHRCNNRHFGECRQGNKGCFTCSQMGHWAIHCLHNQLRPQPHFLLPPVPIQQVLGTSGYTQTGHGGAYHYQGDIAPYSGEQYQYPQSVPAEWLCSVFNGLYAVSTIFSWYITRVF